MNTQPKNRKPCIHLVTMRMQGHAGWSGYDRIIDYLDAIVIAPLPEMTLLPRIIARLFRGPILKSGIQWYHREEFLCEMQAARHWVMRTGGIFHFIYGENSFRYLATIKKLFPKNKIICTFHTPASRFESLVTEKDYLQAIDAAVVVSTSQTAYFSKILSSDKVFFIPHGVDTDAYRPDPDKHVADNRFNCVFVGKHLRDISAMQQIVAKAEQRNPKIHFHLVSDEATLSLFEGRANVTTHRRIPDEALRSLYQSADALVLPLIESTANNSILEAVACGLPVLTTDLVGTRDYLNTDCAVFIPPNEEEAYLTHIEDLMNRPEKRARMAQASRAKALELSWSVVAARFETLYRRIGANPKYAEERTV
jgi:glycosyltransferase involved in cell wall biosynthesis